MKNDLPTYFDDFLKAIGPGDIVSDLIEAHTELRDKLEADEVLAPILVSTFLQGSYRRSTLIRPQELQSADVDVVVVTTLSERGYSPEAAMMKFQPFLDRHYQGNWELQGRSIGICLDTVELDVVVTSVPSQAQIEALKSIELREVSSLEERRQALAAANSGQVRKLFLIREAEDDSWKTDPLRIPDRDAKVWESTHPLAQIEWTWNKNNDCGGHYVRVVRALKWWRRTNHPTPKYPKGYPLEHIIGVNCPDSVGSVAEGVVLTLESISQRYAGFALLGQVPVLPDHGVPEHNVLHRLTGEDFRHFHGQVAAAAKTARHALDSDDLCTKIKLWKQLFGDEFPGNESCDENESTKSQGFTPRTAPSVLPSGRYA